MNVRDIMTVRDALAETVYPSLAATGYGRACGMLLESIPLAIGRIRLSHLLFGPLVAPLAPVLYLVHKLTGRRYRMTQSAVEDWPMIGDRRDARVRLEEIAEASVSRRRGQAFFHAGDIDLLDAAGNRLLRLAGVPRPDRVRQLILDLREAKRQRDAAVATIAARGPVASS